MSATGQTFKDPTDKQVGFYNKLAKGLGFPTIDAFAPGTSRNDASKAIDAMLDLQKSGKTAAKAQTITQVIPAAPATPIALTATGEPALVGKKVFIPYADSCATYTVTAVADGFATLVKATTADPTLKVMDDWTHPLLGVGPTRVEITAGLIGMAQ